jgi:hypothetical protein
MTKVDFKTLNKEKVLKALIDYKRGVLMEFEQDERDRLDAVGNEDMDNRHIDSKNEETLAEMDFLNHNVEILERQILLLRKVDPTSEHDSVRFGSLVHTDMGILLIAAAQERIRVGDEYVLGISTAAPIYKKMEGLKAGDKFEMNGMKHEIKALV